MSAEQDYQVAHERYKELTGNAWIDTPSEAGNSLYTSYVEETGRINAFLAKLFLERHRKAELPGGLLAQRDQVVSVAAEALKASVLEGLEAAVPGRSAAGAPPIWTLRMRRYQDVHDKREIDVVVSAGLEFTSDGALREVLLEAAKAFD